MALRMSGLAKAWVSTCLFLTRSLLDATVPLLDLGGRISFARVFFVSGMRKVGDWAQ